MLIIDNTNPNVTILIATKTGASTITVDTTVENSIITANNNEI
jgi:hypothetical protein